MDKIINENCIEETRCKIDGNLQNAIKHTILNLLETSYTNILESNKFTEQDLEEISNAISENDELNDYIDSLIFNKLDAFTNKNNI